MDTNTSLQTKQTPIAEDICIEFKNAHKAFLTNTGQKPTHVIIPADKLLKISRSAEIRIKHHLDRPNDSIKIVDIPSGSGKFIEGIVNNLITISGYKVIESAPYGNILFGYLPEKE